MMARGTQRPVCSLHGAGGRGADHEPAWESFWDIASPFAAALALRELFGPDAAGAVSKCIVSAAADNRHADRRFWAAVAAELRVIRLPVSTNRWYGRRYVVERSRAGRKRSAIMCPPYPHALPPRAPHRGKSIS